MAVYDPEADFAAPPGDLRDLVDLARPWLIETGMHRVGDPKDADSGILGLYYEEVDGDTLSPDPVVIATDQPTYKREFRVTRDLHLWVPSAAGILAIGSAFYVTYSEPYHPAANLATAPGDYVEADVVVGIPRPDSAAAPQVKARAYQLVVPRNPGGLVTGKRNDVLKDGTLAKDDVNMMPVIRAAEGRTLREVLQFCVQWHGSPHEAQRQQG